mgnify:CR=1 FL=1
MEARSLHHTQSRNYIKNSLWELSKHVTADNIKVKDLASYSGISRTVFYRNFGCLSDVWHSIGHDVLNDIASSQELFYTDKRQGLRENVLQNVAACIYHSKDKIQNITCHSCDQRLFRISKRTQISCQYGNHCVQYTSASYDPQILYSRLLQCRCNTYHIQNPIGTEKQKHRHHNTQDPIKP